MDLSYVQHCMDKKMKESRASSRGATVNGQLVHPGLGPSLGDIFTFIVIAFFVVITIWRCAQ